MVSFECDYTEGAHEQIIRRLVETNMEQTPGYGSDPYTASAKEKIRKAIGKSEADIYFLIGGTQTNSTVIATMLNGYEGVVSVVSGHINAHEAGAVEYTGHKVLTVPSHEGKMHASDLRAYLEGFYKEGSYEHMVFPGMAYISFPTEYGTIYTKQEITDIHDVCQEFNIPLFIDGARLGYGLMAHSCDLTIKDLADLCEVFYIGGTKVGALFGEAVIFPKGNAPKHFFTSIKAHGALLAKGRMLGIQFDTLFTDDLYFKIAGHAIEMADLIKEVFTEKGYRFFKDSPTNQQFIIMPDAKMEELKSKVRFEFWEKYDETNSVVRFASSWATKKENVLMLRDIL
ncbi:MAG: beta-eliminating lyase-related protein [Bacteroidales bacterium]|nr:beta-eliminating lyase-related protein [Bacteroidales bacterium]